MKHLLPILISLLLINCGGSPEITTQWEGPTNSKIRLTKVGEGTVVETTLPSFINIGSSHYKSTLFGSNSHNYFVEIITPQNQRLYGTLDVYGGTKLTELSNVKIEITDAIIKRVLDNQVSQITVRDPAADRNIILLNLGNKMPNEMKELYDDNEITKY